MTSPPAALERFAAIDLETLDATSAFHARTEHKYVVDVRLLDELLNRLTPTHAALDIAGRRAFGYDSVYFDTPQLRNVRAHLQGRPRRMKCRSRLYVDSRSCAFEVKLKTPRGATEKQRLEYPPEAHGTVTPEARAFVGRQAGADPNLLAVLRTTYTRLTLVGEGERVTIDLDVSFGSARIRPAWAIVETKSANGRGAADRVLRTLGNRPVSLSKYVVGTGLTVLRSPPNDIRRVARRYFCDA